MPEHYPTIFNKTTGEIVQSGFFSCSEESVQANFEARMSVYDPATYSCVDAQSDSSLHYVAVVRGEPVVVSRQNMRITIKDGKTTLVANGTDTVQLTGLPDPCTIVQDPGEPEETSYEVTGGGFIFSAETPGRYQFRVDRFPFLPFSIEFTAT